MRRGFHGTRRTTRVPRSQERCNRVANPWDRPQAGAGGRGGAQIQKQQTHKNTAHENAQADTDAADVADAGTNAHVQADAETSDAADAVHGIYLF